MLFKDLGWHLPSSTESVIRCGAQSSNNCVLAQRAILVWACPKSCSAERMMDVFYFQSNTVPGREARKTEKCEMSWGREGKEDWLTVLISVTYCRDCLPFLSLSQTVFWQIDAPIIVLFWGLSMFEDWNVPKVWFNAVLLLIYTPQMCN